MKVVLDKELTDNDAKLTLEWLLRAIPRRVCGYLLLTTPGTMREGSQDAAVA